MAQGLPKQGKLKSGGLDGDLDDEDQRSAVLGMVLFASVLPALLPLPLHSSVFQPVTGTCCVCPRPKMCLSILFWLLLEKGIPQNTKHKFSKKVFSAKGSAEMKNRLSILPETAV